MKTFFIVGTDTEIGKTYVSCWLLRQATRQGLRCLGLKPVATGAIQNARGEWVNEDALNLQAASTVSLPYANINPLLLRAPCSLDIAAALEYTQINAQDVIDACEVRTTTDAELTLIEGVGGWAAPINTSESMADVTIGLNVPVIMVVGIKLGCINHAVLTLQAMQHAGCQVAAWVANGVLPEVAWLDEQIATLKNRLNIPFLGYLPHTPLSLNTSTAMPVTAFMDLASLL